MVKAGHIAPFLVWVGLIFLPDVLTWCGDVLNVSPLKELPYLFPTWTYAAKSVLCAALLIYFKPWRVYPAGTMRDVVLGVGIGFAVAVVWILPETGWATQLFPRLQYHYNLWCILMPGQLPGYYDPAIAPALPTGHTSWVFAPQQCGWALTIAKLLGSSFVIAVIEEYFFRGFLYRWLQSNDFTRVSLKTLDVKPFVLTVVCFGLEHDRWVGGMLAGLAYGALVLRTGALRASIVAHVTTNFLLSLYVIESGQYGFW